MIIGISGKKQTGKDEAGRIINNLCNDKFKVVKFADKLKDVLCVLTGCTREQLEDEDFKNKQLPECWNAYVLESADEYGVYTNYYSSKKELDKAEELLRYDGNYNIISCKDNTPITYRQALQQIGTNLFRDRFHPNTWINATLSNIKNYEDIIITDVRFLNEIDTIKNLGGIVVRIERETVLKDSHSSEMMLNDYNKWNYVINNNGTLRDLEDEIAGFLYCNVKGLLTLK